MTIIKKILPLNRVEGDIEIHFELDENHRVTDARSVGTLYRGIENLMTGRAPLDSLVITPRICGICTTAHLNAAAKALDMAFSVRVPDNAQRLRNVTLLVEHIQNDLRHFFLLFMPDCTRTPYKDHPMHGEALHRFRVLKGESTIQIVQETKKIIEIIAILGGQWPHSSFMVPGGVVSVPSSNDIFQCRHILRNFVKWYERRVLGCTIARWQEVITRKDLEAWLGESPLHQQSELGFFIQFALSAGLDQLGRGCETFISCGGPELPAQTHVKGVGGGNSFLPSGLFSSDGLSPFDQQHIAEDISCAFYHGTTSHPFEGRTMPDLDDAGGRKYSWAKAPRYNGKPAETGPLADLLVAGMPLFVELNRTIGASVFLREFARLVRPALLLPAIEQWLREMADCSSTFFQDYPVSDAAKGYGLVLASRGILGHWVRIEDGKVANYQVITPTAWNASPMDAKGVHGPCEQAIIGTRVHDPDDPVAVEQIVRSFDPCLVCTVHAVDLR
ncbi:MAG: nickel-dependent hydrogenase large subunit [Desulfobacterales bacterium]|jgi:hydrogenase large subunit|nr:nickel-dependent hydrogenase large subunit [Desulfobacterales bacterium]